MSLATQARAAFTAMKTTFASSVVTVVYGSKSATGILGPAANQRELGAAGNTGETTGSVKVDTADLAIPKAGETITVAGEKVFVDNVRVDSAQVLMAIDFSKTRPNT